MYKVQLKEANRVKDNDMQYKPLNLLSQSDLEAEFNVWLDESAIKIFGIAPLRL